MLKTITFNFVKSSVRHVIGLDSSLRNHCKTLDLYIELYMTEKTK